MKILDSMRDTSYEIRVSSCKVMVFKTDYENLEY